MSSKYQLSITTPSQSVTPTKPELSSEQAYEKPDLFLVGSATELLQGPMMNATYRDCHNSGSSYDPQPC